MPESSSSVPRETPILSAPFQLREGGLLWPRIRLYVDRLALTEWWGWRYVWRSVPLNRVAQVEAPTPTTLRIQPRDCDSLVLEIEEARRWTRAIRAFRVCLGPPE